MPYRRNITVISFEEEQLSINDREFPTLNAKDEQIRKYHKYRLIYSERLQKKRINTYKSSNSLMHINTDKEMDKRHKSWREENAQLLESISVNNLDDVNLVEIIKNENIAVKLTYELAKTKVASMDIVPNFMGSLGFENDLSVHWYLEWVVRDYEKLYLLNSNWFVNVILCQFFSIISNPFFIVKRSYIKEVQDIFRFLNGKVDNI